MLNLIPVVMFLLMQGAGGHDMSLRQQQALLDLAQRVQAARSIGGLETELQAQAGVDGQGLALWIQVFSAFVGDRSEPQLEIELVEPYEAHSLVRSATEPGWSESSRPRDGPFAS